MLDPHAVPPSALAVDVFFDNDPDGLSVAEMVTLAAVSGHDGDAALLVGARGPVGFRASRVVYECVLFAREPDEPAVRRRHLRGYRGGRS
jgi:hypothetical protein